MHLLGWLHGPISQCQLAYQLEWYRILIAALIVEFSHLLFYFFVILIRSTLTTLCFKLLRNQRNCSRLSPKHCYHQLIETVWVDGEDMSMLCKSFTPSLLKFPFLGIIFSKLWYGTSNEQVKIITRTRLIMIVHVILTLIEPADE